MKTIDIDGTKVTETTTPNYIQQLFWVKPKVKTFTILNKTFTNFPAYPVLMDSKGKIMSQLSNVAQLVQDKANLAKYSNQ